MTGKKTNYQERRKEIKHLIEEIGIWNINKTDLAKRFNVSRDTIYKDFHKVIDDMETEDLKEIKVNFSAIFKKITKEAHKLVVTGTPKQKLNASKILIEAIEKYTKFLEAYGIKPVTPIEINQNTNIITAEKIKEVYDLVYSK